MGFSWVATELTTGRILNDLRDLDCGGVKQTIGRYEPASMSLPLPTAPVDWQRAVMPGATNLILLADNPADPANGIPVWGGMVTQAPLTHLDVVDVSTATIESYLDRRFVGDETYTQVGQNTILADLITKYVATGPNGGIPIRVQIVNGGAGKLRDRTFKAQDDKTIYSIFTDFMGIESGPEWTIGWERQHNPERITPVIYIGDRIGTAVTPGLGAAAVFEMPGAVREFKLMQDYSNGKGANVVVATSSGQGTVRPQSPPQVAVDLLRPTFEHRFTPSTSISDIDTLTGYASRAVTELSKGTSSLSLSAVVSKAPKLGVDWFIGDDIGYVLGGLRSRGRRILDAFVDIFTDLFGATAVVSVPHDTVPSTPGGMKGVARVVGWELELSNTPVITPILIF